MSKWIHFYTDWFNLDDFANIWIETRFATHNNYDIEPLAPLGYYAMGEWRHNGEEVIITQDLDEMEDLINFLNSKLGISSG